MTTLSKNNCIDEYYKITYMKFLGFKIDRIIIFPIILLFIILFCCMYNTKIIEGLTTDIVIQQINTILDDTTHNEFIKIKAISGIVFMMDDENDQSSFNNVLNNNNLDTSQKISGVKNTIQNIKDRIETQKRNDEQKAKNEEQKNKSDDLKNKSDEASKNSPLRQYD